MIRNEERLFLKLDNRGRILSTLHTTQEKLKKQSAIDPISQRHLTNEHKVSSRFDSANRVIFPLRYILFNIWFWLFNGSTDYNAAVINHTDG